MQPAATATGSITSYALIGLAAGFLSGLLGVGGGIVLVPLMVAVVGFDQHRAHATSLAAIAVISLSGMAGFALGGDVVWWLGLVVAVGAVAGSTIGANTMGRMSPALLRGVFVVVLVIAGIRMVVGGGTAAGTGVDGDVASIVIGLLIGLVSGFAGAVAGIGGGVVIVPGLVFLVGVEQTAAAGTSLMVIVFTALAATRVNWNRERFVLRQALIMGVAGAVSAQAGAAVALETPESVLTRIFGVFALVVAGRMALSLRSHRRRGGRPGA